MEDMDDIQSSHDEEGDDVDDASNDNADDDDDDGESQADSDTFAEDFIARTKVGLSPGELSKLTCSQQMQKWMDTLFPPEADLIHDLDAGNIFFVNAESLIFEAVASGQVNFEEELQFLTLTYAIEHTLQDFRACGGVFRVTFFDCFKHGFSAAMWAYRQVFLFHCQAHGIDHVVFPHWHSSEWKQHVEAWRPSFFLSSLACLDVDEEDDEEEEEEEEEGEDGEGQGADEVGDDGVGSRRRFCKEGDHTLQQRLLQMLAIACLSTKTHVAMLRGIRRSGNRMMSFTIEPDSYDPHIDASAKQACTQMLKRLAEEEEEEESEKIDEKFREFISAAGVKVNDESSLRSFLLVRFLQKSLAKCEPARKAGKKDMVQLMELVAKVMVIEEILLRQMPLQYRAVRLPAVSEWQMYEEKISGAALGQQFVESVAEDLSALYKTGLESIPADRLKACDLFDGRLYRHAFIGVVAEGLSDGAKNKVAGEFFKFQDTVAEELKFLWEMAGSKADFFPIDMTALAKELKDVPSIPGKEAGREKPTLLATQNLDVIDIWDGLPGASYDEVEEDDSSQVANVFAKRKWTQGVNIDTLKYEEHMEKSKGELKLEEKFKKKGKMTEDDHNFIRKWHNKQRQQRLKVIARLAKSLVGADQLMNPIVTVKDEDSDGEMVEEDKEKKISKKQQDILDKQKAVEQKKEADSDDKQLKEWEPSIEKISETLDPEKLEAALLDMLIGFGPARVLDSFERFPRVTEKFKQAHVQAQVVVKVVNATKKALKKMLLDKLPAEKSCRLVRYFVCMIMEAFKSFGKILEGKQVKSLQEGLLAVGFPRTCERLFSAWKKGMLQASAPATQGKPDKKSKGSKEGKESKDAEKELSEFQVSGKKSDLLWSGVGPDEFAWQLMYMGPYMTRTVGRDKDPKGRVKFRPDVWQQNLLDIVDRRQSALVVVPTGGGKTFICYYAMDKVLRTDNDGVCVYVAPTDPLVRQVTSEIYARFSSKTYPANSSSQLFGMLLSKYNHAGGDQKEGRWRNCQILVTKPQVLETLLLNASEGAWLKRLRYVIFDECHKIGEHGGSHWEHIMQLIPCPFLALSATVAEAEYFHSWLQDVSAAKPMVNRKAYKKKSPEVQVHLVQHHERWNDLCKYMVVQGSLRPLHPFCCLTQKIIQTRGLSADLTLTAQEMIQLFQELQAILGKDPDWDVLAPQKYFLDNQSESVFITKGDATKYSKVLKDTFLNILRSGRLDDEQFQKLIGSLQSPRPLTGVDPCFAPPARVDQNASSSASTAEGVDLTKLSRSNSYRQVESLMQLLKHLDSSDIMPAIIFNFSRRELDLMVKVVVKHLQDLQHQKNHGSEEAEYRYKQLMLRRQQDYDSKMKAYEQAQKARASKKQEGQAARKSGEEGRKAGKLEAIDVSEDMTVQAPAPPVDIDDEIDPDLTFHSPKVLGQYQEEIEEMLGEAKFSKVDPTLIEGLRRGIGLHHEGVPAGYRDIVETLFRRGYLRVVFATGTLALGINMPCRSSVFCGDSLELNGLMYRQMSGRAGRRGFDLLGQVIFWDMGFLKVQRLVASDMPSLMGEFKQSASQVLRILKETEQAAIKKQADQTKQVQVLAPDEGKALVKPMLKIPFFRSADAALEKQSCLISRFFVELFRREALISPYGTTSSMTSFVTHLARVEPANFILARLLSKGLLHEYLEHEAKKVIKGDKSTALTVKLAGVVAWFTVRRRLPEQGRSYPHKPGRKRHLPSKDCPLLPTLPPAILNEIKEYSDQVFEIYQQLAYCIGSSKKFYEADVTLPLSQQTFKLDFDKAPKKGVKYFDAFKGQMVKGRARSPFAILAGRSDIFSSPADLVCNARRLLHMDIDQIPMLLPPSADSLVDLEPTNSWAVDILIHEDLKSLAEDNGLGLTIAYPLVDEFREFAALTCYALASLAPPDDIVRTTFEQLLQDLKHILQSTKKGQKKLG